MTNSLQRQPSFLSMISWILVLTSLVAPFQTVDAQTGTAIRAVPIGTAQPDAIPEERTPEARFRTFSVGPFRARVPAPEPEDETGPISLGNGLTLIGADEEPAPETSGAMIAEVKPAEPPSGAQVEPAPASSRSWRNRYEIGVGDSLNFGLHGKPKLTSAGVVVAPDGTVSYLQARQVSVVGKTIDEVREEVERILADGHHHEPQVIITPAALTSKHFTILGEVKKNGNFPLNRPTSLIEALAYSGGFNLGASDQDAIELADLQRSFIVRRGERLDVDMERLYLHGDLSQNVQVEPDDYIYIASKLRREVYVFGQVENPGVCPMETGLTTLGAVARKGGFTRRAWMNRVLIIRGRLENPEQIVVELGATVRGRATDVTLEPGDIVYIHTAPWSYAADILDTAIIAYIDGAVAGALSDDFSVVGSGGRGASASGTR